MILQSFLIIIFSEFYGAFELTRKVNHFFEWITTVGRLWAQASADSIVDIFTFQVALVGDVIDRNAWVQVDTKLGLSFTVSEEQPVICVLITLSLKRRV